SVTGTAHAKTVKKYVISTMQKFFSCRDIFQKNNTMPHKSKVATAICEAHGIKKLSWPPESRLESYREFIT
ncbi:12264_t:CDS:1, partial [Acaulospora morrowiae]